MYKFDPIALQWSQVMPEDVHGVFPSPRIGFGFASANGDLYIFGGIGSTGNTKSVHVSVKL